MTRIVVFETPHAVFWGPKSYRPMTGLPFFEYIQDFLKRRRGPKYDKYCTNHVEELQIMSIVQNFSEKTGSYTETKSFKTKNVSYSFLRTNVKMSTPCLRDKLSRMAHVLYVPIPRSDLQAFLYFISPKEKRGKTQQQQKQQKKQQQQNKQHQRMWSSQECIEDGCKTSRS